MCIVFMILFCGVIFVQEFTKSPEQVRHETLELEGKRRQEEMDDERARQQHKIEVEIEGLKQDMEKHPERYR
jgi:hypothetical protein